MANDYKLQLSIALDTSSLKQSQIDTIAKNYSFSLKIKPDFSDFEKQLQNFKSELGQLQQQIKNTAPSGKGAVLFDEAKNNQILANLQSKMDAIKASATKVIKEGMTEVNTGNGDTLTRSTISYTDSVGKARTATLEWKKNQDGVVEAVKLTNNYLDTSAKSYEKMNSLADKFLDKSKNLEKTADVTQGVQLSNKIKELTSLGATNGGLSPEQTQELDSTYKKLQILNSTVSAGGKDLRGWTNELGLAIKRTIEWATGIALVRGALNQLKEGIEYVQELNKELVTIQTVTGWNNTQINELANSYNAFARTMGATTKQVAEASLEYYRQGKSVAETEELVKSSMYMSKLGNVEAAQATEYMTSILNGFKKSASDSVDVVDKLVAIDNAAATSVSELAEGLSRSANSAQEAKVTFEQLSSYIGTVSAVTRKSASSIGESFKTMFARYQDIQTGGLDETGQSINNVEEALSRVNIKIRETDDTFRPFGDVLADLAKRWNSLSEVEQANIAKALAGVRQRENLLTLLNNYNMALDLQKKETDSSGLAIDRYSIYMQGLEASANKMTAAWENMWSKSINSNSIKFFYEFAAGALNAISSVGGLIPILTAVGGLLLVFNSAKVVQAFSGLFKNIAAAIANFRLMGIAAVTTGQMISIGIGVATVAISALIMLYQNWTTEAERAQQAAADLRIEIERIQSTIKGLGEQQNKLGELGSEFEELKGKAEKTNEEQERFTQIQNDIKEILPQVNGYYDDMGNFILDASTNLETLNTLKQEEIDLNKQLLEQKTKEEIEGQAKAYQVTADRLKTMQMIQNTYTKNGKKDPMYDISSARAIYGTWEELSNKISDADLEVKRSLNLMKQDYASFNEDQKAQFVEYLNNQGEWGKQLASQLDAIAGNWKDHIQELKQFTVEAPVKEYKGLLDTLQGLQSESSTGLGLAGKSATGKINFDDITNFIKENKENIDSLEVENGLVKLNTDEIRKQTIAKAESALATAEAKLAQDQSNTTLQKEVEILQNYVEQSKRAIPQSKEFADNFQLMIQNVASSMGDNATPALQKFLGLLNENSKLFEDGKLKASEYFKTLEDNLNNVNFDKMFGQNKDASQIFFSGMTLNAAQALSQISSAFDAGEISLSEYTKSLSEIGNVFDIIGNSAIKYMDNLGLTGEAAQEMKSEVLDALGGISEGTKGLASLQELNKDLEMEYFRLNEQGLDWASEANQEYLMNLAQAASASGQTFTDMAGNALVGTQQIYNYIKTSQANFSNFATQAAQKTGSSMTKLVQGVGGMLQTLGKAIKGFDAQIQFRPAIAPGFTKVPVKLFGQEMSFIQIPNMDLQITGQSTSLASIGEAISSFGASLSGMDFSNLDNGIYQIPGATNQITGAANDASQAYQDLADAIKAADDAAKKGADEQKKAMDELIKKIKAAADAKKNALKEELDNYKKLIDAQKDKLDQDEKERDYADKKAEQEKAIEDIENEILELSLDTSEEAKAKKLQLEQELADKKKQLEDTEREKTKDDQKKALDDEYNLFKDSIDAKIKALDDFITELGSIQAKTLQELLDKLSSLGVTVNVETGEFETHHSGLDSGFAGGTAPNRESEVFAKLMKGEAVLNQRDISTFMGKTLPNLIFGQTPQFASNAGGGFSCDHLMEIIVQGNLDKSVLPDLEKIANKVMEKIGSGMGDRGFIRKTSTSFS